MKRPTIDELEAMLAREEPMQIELQPNGEIRAVPILPLMNIRDWFAGQALMGLCSDPGYVAPAKAAPLAYLYADAMLIARDQVAKPHQEDPDHAPSRAATPPAP